MNSLRFDPDDEDDDKPLVALANTVTPKKPKLDTEKGVPYDLPFGTFTDFVTLNRDQAAAPDRRLIDVDRLVEMRQKDGTVRALLRLIQLPILRALQDAEWIAPDDLEEKTQPKPKQAKPEEPPPVEDESEAPELTALASGSPPGSTPNDKEIPPEVVFANQMFTLPKSMGGMSISQTRFMREVLLAIIEGFSFFEIVNTVPDRGPLKGKIAIKKFAHRDSRTIKFLVDDNGGFDGAKQSFMWKGERKEIEYRQDEVWYYAVSEEENPFYGVSMFESAYHHWDIKRKLYYLAHIAAQLAATVARVGTIPLGAAPKEIKAFQDMLAKFAFNFSGTMPAGYEVQFQTQSTGFNFLPLIDHQNQQMAKSVLAKFIEDENRQVLIENAGQDASADFFVMAVEAIMAEIAESLTHHVMPRYIDWNFGTDVYPVFRFGIINDATRDIIKELFIAIATAQTSQWTPEFIREMEKKLVDRLGLEVDYDEVEKREEEDKAKQAELEQQYFAQQQGGGGEEEDQGDGGPPPRSANPAFPHPAEIAASVTSGGVSLSRAMDQIERAFLARRESDVDGGT